MLELMGGVSGGGLMSSVDEEDSLEDHDFGRRNDNTNHWRVG